MKLKNLSTLLKVDYTTIQKWVKLYNFDVKKESNSIFLDSNQIEIITKTAEVFREYREKKHKITFEKVKKIVLGIEDSKIELTAPTKTIESNAEKDSIMLEKLSNLESNLNQVVDMSLKLSKISYELGTIEKENSYLKTISQNNQEIIIKLESDLEAKNNENRILLQSLATEKEARKDLEAKIDSINLELESLKQKRFLGFRINK
jgi:chromosome segregation ATPase